MKEKDLPTWKYTAGMEWSPSQVLKLFREYAEIKYKKTLTEEEEYELMSEAKERAPHGLDVDDIMEIMAGQLYEFEKGGKTGYNKKCKVGTQTQSLMFDKEKFTEKEAKSWAKKHGKKYGKTDITDKKIRLRQQDPSRFEEESMRTIPLTKGVKAVIGCPAGKKEKGGAVSDAFMQEYADENPKYDILDYGDYWVLARNGMTHRASFAYVPTGFINEDGSYNGYMNFDLLSDVANPYDKIFKKSIKKNNLQLTKFDDGNKYYERILNKMEKGGAIEIEVIDGGNKFYLTKIDSTHFYMSVSPDEKGGVYHIGQIKDKPYYKKVNEWLSNSKKVEIIRGDENYRDAVNYKQSFYNFPVTANVAGKKFIIGAGSSDSITVIDNIKYGLPEYEVFILSENRGLNYISLEVIDLDKDTTHSVFLQDSDLSNEENLSYDLLNKSEEEQLEVLFQYMEKGGVVKSLAGIDWLITGNIL